MSKLRFTTDHEWLRQDDDGLLTVGITAYAQDALGDVVFVQLPELGEHAAGSEVAVLETNSSPAISARAPPTPRPCSSAWATTRWTR